MNTRNKTKDRNDHLSLVERMNDISSRQLNNFISNFGGSPLHPGEFEFSWDIGGIYLNFSIELNPGEASTVISSLSDVCSISEGAITRHVNKAPPEGELPRIYHDVMFKYLNKTFNRVKSNHGFLFKNIWVSDQDEIIVLDSNHSGSYNFMLPMLSDITGKGYHELANEIINIGWTSVKLYDELITNIEQIRTWAMRKVELKRKDFIIMKLMVFLSRLLTKP